MAKRNVPTDSRPKAAGPRPKKEGLRPKTEGLRPKAQGLRRPKAKEHFPKPVAAAIRAALDKKAEDVVVLDLRKAQGFTDFFVI